MGVASENVWRYYLGRSVHVTRPTFSVGGTIPWPGLPGLCSGASPQSAVRTGDVMWAAASSSSPASWPGPLNGTQMRPLSLNQQEEEPRGHRCRWRPESIPGVLHSCLTLPWCWLSSLSLRCWDSKYFPSCVYYAGLPGGWDSGLHAQEGEHFTHRDLSFARKIYQLRWLTL